MKLPNGGQNDFGIVLMALGSVLLVGGIVWSLVVWWGRNDKRDSGPDVR